MEAADKLIKAARAVMARHEKETAGRICLEWREMAAMRKSLALYDAKRTAHVTAPADDDPLTIANMSGRHDGARLNLSDPAVQKRLAAQWGYVRANDQGTAPAGRAPPEGDAGSQSRAVPPELPPLTHPDTHCFDSDTGKDVWSYSADLTHAYASAAIDAAIAAQGGAK